MTNEIGMFFGYKIEERKTKTKVLKLPKEIIEFLMSKIKEDIVE